MEITFKNKKILVTGSGQGIGREVCKRLHGDGACVYALSVTTEHMESLLAECPGVNPILVDLRDWDKTAEALANVEPLDGLVSCAGVDIKGHFMEATQDDIDTSFCLNVRALAQVTQIVSRKMIAAGKGGSIVHICSIVAGGSPFSALTASKAALFQLAKNMAVELGPHQIRVNCVSPTFVMTKKVLEILKDPAEAQMAEEYRKKTPLGRFCQVEDVVNAVFFLLSDKASSCTGANLLTDGGISAN